MSYVVTEPCIGCRYGKCVQVCPVDAFHAGPNFMVINPNVCINCAICEMVCPTSAIVAEFSLLPHQHEYLGLNASLAQRWPLADTVPPLPDAEESALIQEKREQLII